MIFVQNLPSDCHRGDLHGVQRAQACPQPRRALEPGAATATKLKESLWKKRDIFQECKFVLFARKLQM